MKRTRRCQRWYSIVIFLPMLCLSACATDYLVPAVPVLDQEEVQPSVTIVPTGTISQVRTPTRSIQAATPGLPATTVVETTPDDACVQAAFIADVTIPDGMEMDRNQIFLKIWRLKNAGECAWPADLMLEPAGGDELGHAQAVPLKAYPEAYPILDSLGERAWADAVLGEIGPGETVDVPLMFQAPEAAGDFFSVWSLRSQGSGAVLLQVYVQIRVEDVETPAPTIWGGEWVQHNFHIGAAPVSLYLQQRELQVRGYFYTPEGELYLLEGGVFDDGRKVAGTFGPPYHDGFIFEWQLMRGEQAFQGVYQDRLVSAGAWCGARSIENLPARCTLEP